jgi:hypothetical protein
MPKWKMDSNSFPEPLIEHHHDDYVARVIDRILTEPWTVNTRCLFTILKETVVCILI